MEACRRGGKHQKAQAAIAEESGRAERAGRAPVAAAAVVTAVVPTVVPAVRHGHTPSWRRAGAALLFGSMKRGAVFYSLLCCGPWCSRGVLPYLDL